MVTHHATKERLYSRIVYETGVHEIRQFFVAKASSSIMDFGGLTG
jgi:hypothetical protein